MGRTCATGVELQNAYIHLYEQLRKYVWPIETVSLIAQLEVEVFTAFPDMDAVLSIFTKLRAATYYIDVPNNDEYRKTFETFMETVNTFHNIYLRLTSVTEVKS